MNKYRIIKASIALQLAFVFSLAGCGKKEVVQVNDEVKNVKVISAAKSAITVNTEYGSKLKPGTEINVTSKLPGKVESVRFDIGQEVKAGDVLFTIDSREIQAQYDQSSAALSSAQSNLIRTEDSQFSQQIVLAESQLQSAQVQYDDAKRIYNNTKSLFDKGAASQQDMDNITSKLKSAEIQLDTANTNLKVLKEKVMPQSIDAASSQVSQAKAGVSYAQTQLDNATITSPVSGVVSARNIDAGELVSSAVPAYTIIDSRALEAEINLSDKMVTKVSLGQKVSLKVNAFENKNVEGSISSISPNADPRTQLYVIKIKIDNSDGSLKPGMFAKVMLPVETKDNAVVVPNEAIVVENGVQYVYIVESDKIQKRLVTIGITNNKMTEVTSNLKENDIVVVEGQSFLSEGEKVSVLK